MGEIGNARASLLAATRAQDTARTIAEKSVSITVQRGSTTLPAQTVRLDTGGPSPRQVNTPNTATASLQMVLLGYKAHPTIADTDVERGDRFLYGGERYRVIQVLPETPGRLVAIAEVLPDA